MPMNDKTAQYVKMLKAHVDRIVVGVVYVLLALLVWFWYSEQTTTDTGQNAPQPPKLVDPVPDNPGYKMITRAMETPDISKYPEIDAVRKFNMFDYKTVREKQQVEQGANEKFKQAQDAAAKGQTEEAKRLLKDCLDAFPTHAKARELLDKLTGANASGSQANPSGTAAPAGARGTPAPPGSGSSPGSGGAGNVATPVK